MNAIHETLEELHRNSGIRGASVVTLDGLVAADSLDVGFSSDVVAGLASFLLMTMNRSLREGGMGECRQFMLHATHGKVVLMALDDAYLVVVFDQFADVQAVKGEIAEAAERIRRSSHLS